MTKSRPKLMRGAGTVSDESERRPMALIELLAYIYPGKGREPWDFSIFYKLSDKEAVRRRIKAILARQHVYKFIYNTRDYK